MPEQPYRTQLNPPEGGEFETANGFAISPDGRTLALVATAPGRSGLWLRPMDGTTARLLPGTQGAGYPFWAPDGRSLAYWASGKLWRVDAGGGAPIAICDIPVFLGGEWSVDGSIVFASEGLRRVSATGGTPEALTTPDAGRGEIAYRYPQLLPRGRILFHVLGKPEQTGTYATSLANPRERVRLLANSAALYVAGHLLWLRGSTLVAQRFDPEQLTLAGEPGPIAEGAGAAGYGKMLVASSASGLLVYARAGLAQLTWVDRAGQSAASATTPSAINKSSSTLGEPGDYVTFRFSPDGRRVAVGRSTGRGRDLWMVEVARDAWSRFTLLPGTAWFPVWSPDGRQVMFSGGAAFNLYRKEASGAGTEQRVTESANTMVPTDWSRDGLCSTPSSPRTPCGPYGCCP